MRCEFNNASKLEIAFFHDGCFPLLLTLPARQHLPSCFNRLNAILTNISNISSQ